MHRREPSMFDTPDFLRALVVGLLVGALLHVLSACGDIAPHDNGDQGPPRKLQVVTQLLRRNKK